MIAKIDENKTPEKCLSVLDAIMWTVSAVSCIKPATVRKCFLKAGFPNKIIAKEPQPEEIICEPDLEELNLLVHTLYSESMAEEFLALDDNLETSNEDTDIIIIFFFCS